MNSNDNDFDWHKPGIWLAHDADGGLLHATLAATPWSCRSSLMAVTQFSWTNLKERGYVVQEYVPVDHDVPNSSITVKDEVAVGAEARWRYPANGELPPAGATVQLLTRGRVMVRGVWTDSGDFIAWAPMIKRDKELEARLGL